MEITRENSIGHWMHRVGMAFRAHLDAKTREIGLASPEAFLLHVLDHLGPTSLVGISRTIGHAHPSVLRHIDSLEKAGYLERSAHPGDRRVKLLRLTQRGADRVPAVNRLIAETHQTATEGFDESTIEHLLSLLRKMAANLGCDESSDACIEQHVSPGHASRRNRKRQTDE